MKYVYTLSSLNPGGSERQTIEIVRRHVEAGHDVTLVLPNGGGVMPGNYAPLVEQYGIPTISTVTEIDKYAALVRVLGDLKPDVVNSVGYPMTLTSTMAAYEVGVPVRVIRYANTGFTRQQFPVPWKEEMAAHAAATSIVGNSQAVADNFHLYHGITPDKVSVITNGVDIPEENHRKAAREYWGADDGVILIGQLGNFRADGLKNQTMAVRAARRLVDRGVSGLNGWQIILCGAKSDYQDEVEAEIERLNVEQWVSIPGQLKNHDRLDGWDVTLNTSRTEGLSNAVQECMARGIPAVVTDCGGNPELVTDGVEGFIVPDNDDEALADRLRTLIASQSKRAAMGKNARQRMIDNHDWDSVMEQWIALYEKDYAQCSR